MPPHTRSQRRRQTARQQPRQRNEHNDTLPTLVEVPVGDLQSVATETLPLIQEVPVGTAVRAEAARATATRRASASAAETRSSSARRRARPAPEPVDYTSDYRSVRHDLRWIAIWTLLLFAAMLALRFSGLV